MRARPKREATAVISCADPSGTCRALPDTGVASGTPANGISRSGTPCPWIWLPLRRVSGRSPRKRGYRHPVTGRLVIFSGPSGVGKDTVLDAWRLRNPLVQRVVAATTRAPRPGEVDGVDYHFLTREAFLNKANCNEMLEFKEVFGNLYGTPVEGMERLLAEGKVAILKIDVQGGLEVMAKRPGAVTVFLLPPSKAELEDRLRARSTDDPEDIEVRLKAAHTELAIGTTCYEHLVLNVEVDRTVDELEAILNG